MVALTLRSTHCHWEPQAFGPGLARPVRPNRGFTKDATSDNSTIAFLASWEFESSRSWRTNSVRYRADITAGSLKVAESRQIADLLLRGADDAAWKAAIERQNVLQTRSPSTARRLSRLIRNRLETMSPNLWRLVRDGNQTVATHACLAAATKHSNLLADFLRLVVQEQYRVFAESLTRQSWDAFISDCQSRDAESAGWSESTIRRLRSSVFHILEQAGYIESTKSLRLQRIDIAEPVVAYLQKHDDTKVLEAIQISA